MNEMDAMKCSLQCPKSGDTRDRVSPPDATTWRQVGPSVTYVERITRAVFVVHELQVPAFPASTLSCSCRYSRNCRAVLAVETEILSRFRC